MSDMDALTAAETIASAVALCNKALGILRVSEQLDRGPLEARPVYDNIQMISTILECLGAFISIYKPNTTSEDVVLEILRRSHGDLGIVAQTVEKIWQPLSRERARILKARFVFHKRDLEKLNSLLERIREDLSLMTSVLNRISNQRSLEILQTFEPKLRSSFSTSEEQQLRAKSRATLEADLKIVTSTNSILRPDIPRTWTKEVLQRILSEKLPAQVKVITNFPQDTPTQVTGNDLHTGRSYKAEELIPWVSTKNPEPLYDRVDRSFQTKLIFVDSGDDDAQSDLTVPFAEDTYLQLAERLSIPSAMAAALEQPMPRVETWTSTHETLSEGIIIRAPVSNRKTRENWAMSLGWNKQHSTASGLVVGFVESDYAFLKRHQARFDSMHHPLQIPLLLIEAIIARDGTELRKWGESLVMVETKMTLSDLGSDSILSKIDFDDLIRRLTSAMSKLAFLEMRISGLASMMHRIRQCARKANEANPKDTQDVHTQLEENITMLCEHADSLASVVAYQKQHSQLLADLVYTMLQQRDNKLSHGLAESSNALADRAKADSTAMKALGIVSAIFLPGTFMSALFSMGMFDWHAAPGNKVVSDRFWIYWAFTTPITVLLLVCFFSFVWVRNQTKEEGNGLRYGAGRQLGDGQGLETPFQSLKRRHTSRQAEKAAHAVSEGNRPRLRRFWRASRQNGEAENHGPHAREGVGV